MEGDPSAPLDWYGTVWGEGALNRLMVWLTALPRARWTERDPNGFSLLQYACLGDNVAAVVTLVAHGLDVNSRSVEGWVAAHDAVLHDQPRVLEVLCAAGADLGARDVHGYAPLDVQLQHSRVRSDACARVLVANGVRLSTAHDESRPLITAELEAFERGVLRCRAAVVAMLRVKRVSGELWRWDKFLLAEMAVCVWATRYDKIWQSDHVGVHSNSQSTLEVQVPVADAPVVVIDWDAAARSAHARTLRSLLAQLPRALWAQVGGERKSTLLHLACISDVASAVALLAHGLDPNAPDLFGWTAVHYCALFGPPRVMEVLCCVGANMVARDSNHLTPLDVVVCNWGQNPTAHACARVLLANGARLRSLDPLFHHRIPPELCALEGGVLRCRAVVVAMMYVKRAGHLAHWDKFLLRFVALEIWATRCAQEWSAAEN